MSSPEEFDESVETKIEGPVSGNPAVAVTQTTDGAPPVISSPEDPPIKIQKNYASEIAAIASLASAVGAVLSVAGQSPGLSIVLAICATFLIALIFIGKKVEKITEAYLRSRGDRYNVTFKK